MRPHTPILAPAAKAVRASRGAARSAPGYRPRATAGPQPPIDAVQQLPVIRAWHAPRLVRQQRLDGRMIDHSKSVSSEAGLAMVDARSDVVTRRRLRKT